MRTANITKLGSERDLKTYVGLLAYEDCIQVAWSETEPSHRAGLAVPCDRKDTNKALSSVFEVSFKKNVIDYIIASTS